MSSISSTLRPTRNGFRYSSTAVLTTSARCVNVAQPQPTRPGSVVSTLTTTRRMRLGAVRMVLMSRILTGAVPRTACSNADDTPGEIAPAIASPVGMSDAPPAMDIEVIASRRFIMEVSSAACGLVELIGNAPRRFLAGLGAHVDVRLGTDCQVRRPEIDLHERPIAGDVDPGATLAIL